MTKKWFKAALIRALRTMAQTAVATIGTTAETIGTIAETISSVNWLLVLSSSVLAAILSLLTSVATGLPECKEQSDE